jgi:TolB-like protein
LAAKPFVAVLPFVNLSGDAEQDYLIDGISDDLINALSRLTNIYVIARTSSFTYKGKLVDARVQFKILKSVYFLRHSIYPSVLRNRSRLNHMWS